MPYTRAHSLPNGHGLANRKRIYEEIRELFRKKSTHTTATCKEFPRSISRPTGKTTLPPISAPLCSKALQSSCLHQLRGPDEPYRQQLRLRLISAESCTLLLAAVFTLRLAGRLSSPKNLA